MNKHLESWLAKIINTALGIASLLSGLFLKNESLISIGVILITTAALMGVVSNSKENLAMLKDAWLDGSIKSNTKNNATGIVLVIAGFVVTVIGFTFPEYFLLCGGILLIIFLIVAALSFKQISTTTKKQTP